MAIKKTICLIFVVFLYLTTSGADWPCSGGNIGRTNWSTETGLLPDSTKVAESGLKMLWRYQTLGTGYMDPIIAGDKAYIPEIEGHLSCLSLDNGELVWRYHRSRSNTQGGAVCYYGGKIFLSTWEKLNPMQVLPKNCRLEILLLRLF